MSAFATATCGRGTSCVASARPQRSFCGRRMSSYDVFNEPSFESSRHHPISFPEAAIHGYTSQVCELAIALVISPMHGTRTSDLSYARTTHETRYRTSFAYARMITCSSISARSLCVTDDLTVTGERTREGRQLQVAAQASPRPQEILTITARRYLFPSRCAWIGDGGSPPVYDGSGAVLTAGPLLILSSRRAHSRGVRTCD